MTVNTIGIIGAMDEEIDLIKRNITMTQAIDRAGCLFLEGKIGKKNVVVVKSGIGKVNAAMCAQILIDVFKVEAIINTGVGGSIAKDLAIGDVVISSDALHHDFDCSPLGDPIGVIPRLKESIFKADENLVQAAYNASVSTILGKTKIGRIVSGDQFIADDSTKEMLCIIFKGDCAEMEGAAIAQVCYLNKVPFVIIRNISDSADSKADITFGEFAKTAAEYSGRIVLEMLKNL